MDKKILIPILITVLLRLYPFNFYGFQGSDPYVHFSVANQFEKYGLSRGYTLSNYPDGVLITEPFGLYIIPLTFYHLIPSSLISVFQLMPVIFAVISIMVSYLLFKELFDDRLAIVTSVFLSLSIANMTRTGFGVYRGEMLMMPFFLASILFLVKGMKINGWKRNQLIDKIVTFSISGILLGICPFLWYGYPFAFVTVLLVTSVLVLYGFLIGDIKKPLFAFFVVSLVSFAIVKMIVFLGLLPVEHRFTSAYLPLLIPVFSFVFIVLYYLNDKLNKKRKKILISALLISFPLIFVINPNISGTNLSDIFSGFGAAIPLEAYTQAIDELQRPTIEFLFLTLDITLVLAVLGSIILVLKTMIEHDWKKILFIAFSIPVIYLSLSALRFIFLGSFIFCALSSYFFVEMLKQKDKEKVYLMLLIVIFVVMFVHVLQVRSQLEFNNYWDNALVWIKTNVGLSEGIATWRDDAGIIQAFAERMTTTDSVFGQNESKLLEVSDFLLSNTPKNISAEYLVLDKNRLTDMAAIASMMQIPGDFSFIELGIVNYGEMVQTYPTEFYINLTSKKAYGNNLPIDLMTMNGTDVSYHLASEPRILGCLLLQSTNALYLSEELCQSNFVRMSLLQGINGYKLVYKDSYISVYEVCDRTGC